MLLVDVDQPRRFELRLSRLLVDPVTTYLSSAPPCEKSEDWSQNSTPEEATAPYVEAQLLRQVAVGNQ